MRFRGMVWVEMRCMRLWGMVWIEMRRMWVGVRVLHKVWHVR
jgi:hypothetical protein